MKIKCRELNEGETLQIGDFIVVETAFGKRTYKKVTRLTKRHACVTLNEFSEEKYPIIYSRFGYNSIHADVWSTSNITAWRPTDESGKT